MAEFLTTAEITARLERVIGDAKDHLLIISPYLSVNERLRNRIESKASSGVRVHIIYRHKEQGPEVSAWLESLTNVKTSFCENLHAKCYLNEREAILTSMNLYEFSQVNNYEMGVLISRRRESGLFQKIIAEVKHIRDASTTVREPERSPSENLSTVEVVGNVLKKFGRMLEQDRETKRIESPESSRSGDTVPLGETLVTSLNSVEDSKKRSSAKETRKLSRKKPVTPTEGFCIRCKDTISANPAQPYCSRCFRSWNRYKNEAYAEKHCHLCGNEHDTTTMLKPACLACYRKYKDVLEFAASYQAVSVSRLSRQ